MTQEESLAQLVESINDLNKQVVKTSLLVATLEERLSNALRQDMYIFEKIEKNENHIDELKSYKNRMIGFIAALSLLGGGVGSVTTKKLMAVLSEPKTKQVKLNTNPKGD